MKPIVVTVMAVLVVTMLLVPVHAFALKNLFGCITRASSGGQLTFKDYVNCFNLEFHKQITSPASLSNPDVSVTP